MVLIKHDTGSYRTTTWAWWSEDGHHKLRFSPNFHSEKDAYEWHEAVVDSILKESKHKEAVGKQCTCDNCTCNTSPEHLHADSKNSGGRKNKANLNKSD